MTHIQPVVQLNNNNLLDPKQSTFRPSDCCIHQLVAILLEDSQSFDCNHSLDARGVFLDTF